MTPARCLPICLLAALAGGPAAARTLRPEDLAESWRWRRFDREEGLPAGSISAIGHDRDDNIYAASSRGLHRYYRGIVWTLLAAEESFEGGPIERILESGANVYAASRRGVWTVRATDLGRILQGERLILATGPLGGVYAIDAARRIHYKIEKDAGSPIDDVPLPPAEILDYTVDDRRMHWLATRDGLYRRPQPGALRWASDPDLPPDLRGRPCLRLFLLRRDAVARGPVAVPAPLGPPGYELWALFEGPPPAPGTPGQRYILAQQADSGWRPSGLDPGDSPVADLILDAGGNMIAINERGAIQLSADGGNSWSLVPQPDFIPGVLSGGCIDHHGYVWFRAGTAAVFRFDGSSRRWERYWHGLGLPSNNVLCILEASDGKVWAGTEDCVYAYPAGGPGEPAVYRAVGETRLRSVTGLAEDRTGKIWISSSEAFKGVFFFENGVWNRVGPPDRPGAAPGIATQPIWRIVLDRAGDLWFLSAASPPAAKAGEAGGWLYQCSPGYTVPTFHPMAIPRGPATDLLQAQDRSYWYATVQGLLRASASGDEVRIYTERDGLRSSRIWAIAEASDRSIWICYDPSAASGVTRLSGEGAKTFDERDGLASPNARSVICTLSPGGSDVWLGTDRGIVRFDGDCWYNYAVASLARQESEVWPLAAAGTRRPGFAPEGGSVLAGVTGHGIYRLRLDDQRRPQITRLDFDRTPDGAVTFRWDGRDFKNETPPADLRFRSRIDSGPWTAFGPERSRTERSLPPGDHTFRVEMRDLDGNTNREEYTRPFKIPVRASSLLPPIVLAALGGAGGALALTALALGLAWRSRRRAGSAEMPARTASLLAAFPGGVLAIDRAGKIAAVSGGRPDALGLPAPPGPEVLGCPAEILPVLQGEAAKDAVRRALAGEPASAEGVHFAGPTAGGRLADLGAFPLRGGADRPAGAGGATGALVLVEDVTAERRAREVRERTRRLGALQDLAARVAAELGGGPGDPRAGEVLADLRRFAGGDPLAGPRESLGLAGIVEKMLGKRPEGVDADAALIDLPAGVEVNVSAQMGLWSVPGDRRAIRLGLAEVLRNAGEAMPDGGRLSVRLRNRRVDVGDPADLTPGPFVEIEVADSGPGIGLQEAARAFDPFFSTKPRDRARGLGLSVAYGVVRRHRGDIRIASSPGAGTTVTVLLPADPGL